MENEPDIAPVSAIPVELNSSVANGEDWSTNSQLDEDRIASARVDSASPSTPLEQEGTPAVQVRPQSEGGEKQERGEQSVAGDIAVESSDPVEQETGANEAVPEKQFEIGSKSTPEAAVTALDATPSTLVPFPTAESIDTSSSIIEPIPSKTPSTITSTLLASNPPSRAPTPTLTPSVTTPPTPSVSPAPPKKFASSLSVNKKFLEKAGEKSKPEVKAAVGTSCCYIHARL